MSSFLGSFLGGSGEGDEEVFVVPPEGVEGEDGNITPARKSERTKKSIDYTEGRKNKKRSCSPNTGSQRKSSKMSGSEGMSAAQSFVVQHSPQVKNTVKKTPDQNNLTMTQTNLKDLGASNSNADLLDNIQAMINKMGSGLNGRLDNLASAFASDIDKMGRKVDNISSGLGSRIAEVAGEMDGLRKKIEEDGVSMDRRLRELEKRPLTVPSSTTNASRDTDSLR